MSKELIANWRVRANRVAETSFDYRDALQVAREIQSAAGKSSISYRAAQVIHIIENIQRPPEPSARQIADAKTAFNSLRKALDQKTVH